MAETDGPPGTRPASPRRAVALVAGLNAGSFVVEFAVALAIGSVALVADSIDFLEDAALNLLVVFALAWSARRRGHVGRFLAGLLLLPTAAFLWALWQKLQDPTPPDGGPLTLTGAGALVVNTVCTLVLLRHRRHGSSLVRATFLSSRNDILANLAIITAGLVTLRWASVWPDVAVGVGIGLLNLDAAREVWKAAGKEGETPATP